MRPDFDSYAMILARAAATRGTCSLRLVGAILVVEGHPRETGYNGAREGARHCDHDRYARPADDPDLAWTGDSWRCVRALHAEANVVRFARKHGTPLVGHVVYATCRPCAACTEALLDARVGEIVTPAGQDTEALERALQGTGTVMRLVPAWL